MNVLIRKFFLSIFVITLLNSCAAINVTTSSIKEKGIKEAISDGMIDAGINKEFLNHDINMFLNVEIEVVTLIAAQEFNKVITKIDKKNFLINTFMS